MPQPPKPGSKSDRDALRAQMTAAGCSPSEIVTEMRTRWRLRPREAWRHVHGMSQQEVADQLNALATARPHGEAVAADASLVGKWEKWPGPSGRRPTLATLGLLAELYRCDVEDLVDFEDRRRLPEGELRILRHVAHAAITPPAPASPAVTNPAVTNPAPEPACGSDLVHTAAVKSSTWASWAETSNVGDIALEQLLHDTRAIAADYLTADPVALFIRTCALRDRVFRLLEGHQPPRQSTELYVAGGYLCALLAWMSSDLGQLRDADTQGRTAWLCAELADHNGLRAWTLSTRSKVAFWDGRLRDAVNYARQGALYTAPGTVGTLLACQEADAWSVLGARDETDTALQRASQARETQRGQDDIGGLFSCPPLRHANYASAAHLRCGDPQRALAEATAALTQQAGHAYGTVAQVHISAAGAHLALNSPDGAAQALQPVFALPPERRLAPVTARVQELARPLTQTRLVGTVARSLRQRIEDFALDSASRHALTTS